MCATAMASSRLMTASTASKSVLLENGRVRFRQEEGGWTFRLQLLQYSKLAYNCTPNVLTHIPKVCKEFCIPKILA